MNADKNTALYEKMAAEQDKFRDWLKSQPPNEILHHAYEYAVREDILMAMEELDLPQSRAAALLASPSPLADVYKEFADRETSYMDVVRDSIEQRAEAALDTQRELPLYRHDAAHAREQGDLDLYRASRRANIACKEAIETAIADNYRDNRLDRDAVPQVIEQFGYARTLYVLANTVQQKDWDGRFSSANKTWAKTVDIPPNPDLGQQDVGQDCGHPAQPGRLRRRTQSGLCGRQPFRPGRSVSDPGPTGLSAPPAADAGGNPGRGRPAVAGASRPGYPQQPPRHPLHGPRVAGLSGPCRHPGPRPADEIAAVPQPGDYRAGGPSRHLCDHPCQRGPQ